MKVKLREIIGSLQALNSLAGQPFPAKVSYKLSRILEQAGKASGDFEKEKITVYQRYGELADKATQTWKLKDESMPVALAELNDLLDVEVPLWGDPFKFSEMGDFRASAADLITLRWLITDDAEVAEPPTEPATQPAIQ